MRVSANASNAKAYIRTDCIYTRAYGYARRTNGNLCMNRCAQRIEDVPELAGFLSNAFIIRISYEAENDNCFRV